MKIENILNIDENLKLRQGNIGYTVKGISNIDSFKKNHLIFIGKDKLLKSYLENDSYDGSEVIVISSKLVQNFLVDLENKNLVVIETENFPMSMCAISKLFYDMTFSDMNYQVDGRKMGTTKIHPSTIIAENVFIGENVTIGEDSTIMAGATILPNSNIGNNTVIYPNVSIMPFSTIGSRCRIHSGTTIGSDGFGYNFENGVHHKIWHMGGVKIGDDVEIGSGCTIDQGTFSPTIIGSGSKLDNSVHIAHNVKIDSGVILCGQVGVAGSSKVGSYTVMGGKAGVSDGLVVGQATQIGGGSLVMGNLEDGSKVAGHPARPVNEWMRGLAYVRKESLKKK